MSLDNLFGNISQKALSDIPKIKHPWALNQTRMIQAFRRFNMTVWRCFQKGNTVSRKAAQKISRWRKNWVAIESNFPLQYYHWSEFLSFYLNFSIDWSVGPFAAHSNISQVYFIKNTIILIEVMFGEGNLPNLKDVDSQDSCVLKLRTSNNFWPVLR